MKYKNRTLKVGLLLAFLFLFALGQSASAQTNTWTGATDNDWNTAGNWSGGVPTNAHDVVINTGATVNLSAGGVAQSITINGNSVLTLATNTLTVGATTAGDVTLNGTSEIDVNGSTLVLGAAGQVSNLNIGAGTTIDAMSGTVTISGTINVASGGTLSTTTATDLILIGTTAVTLPDDITDLYDFTINKTGATPTVTLSGNLNVDNDLTVTNGTLATSTYTLAVGNNVAIANSATAILNATGGTLNVTGNVTVGGAAGGTLNLTGATVTLDGTITKGNAAATITTTSTTNLTLTEAGAVALPADIANLNNLTLNDAANVTTLAGNLTIASDLTITNGELDIVTYTLAVGDDLTIANVATAVLDASDECILTVAGDASIGGGVGGEIDLTGATATFAGGLTIGSAATFTTTGATLLTLSGSSPVQFIAGITAIGKLTINKPSGNVKLGAADLTLGGALGTSGGLTISGAANLDLNGQDVILAQVTNVISESSTGTIINTGASAYVTTALAGSTSAQIIASGIGVNAISPDIASTTIRVLRYPQSSSISSNSSVSRIYQVTTTATNIDSISFVYKESELVLNKDLTLKVYKAPQAGGIGGTYTEIAGSVLNAVNGLVAIKPNAAISAAVAGDFYTFLGDQVTANYTKVFVGTTDNDWNDASNWLPSGIPTTSDSLLIPTGKHVTLGATSYAKHITIEGSSSLNTSTFQLEVATAAAGGIRLKGNSSLIFPAAATSVIGNATYRGDIEMLDNSNISFTTASAILSLSGTWTKATNASITNTEPPTFHFTGTTALSLPSTINNAVKVLLQKTGSTGTVTLNGNLTLSANIDIETGTLIIGNNNLSVATTTEIDAGATLNANYTDNTVTRVFAGAVTITGTLNSSGPRASTGYNNTFTVGMSIPATGVLTINDGKTLFDDVLSGAAPGAVINANRAFVYFDGIVTWTNLTLNTNNQTDLTFDAAQTGAGTTLPAMTVRDLTFLNNATFNGNISVYGDFLNTAGMTTTVGAFTLTVYGDFNNPNTGIVSLAGSTLNLYGSVTNWGADVAGFATTLTTTLNIGGSGSLAVFPAWGAINFGALTLDRADEVFNLAAASGIHTFASLTISAGTVRLGDGFVHVVTAATNIEANGILDLRTDGFAATHGITFSGALGGSGTIYADNGDAATAPRLTIAGDYTFSGILNTDANTDIYITSVQAADISLPHSITALNDLRITRGALARTVTLNNDLAITNLISPATNWVTGTLVLNGRNLTITGGVDAGGAAASFLLDASNNSTITLGAATVFTNLAVTSDETTDLSITGNTTAFNTNANSPVVECKNLSVVSGTTTITAALTVYGNLDVDGTLDKGILNLTVYGNVANAGTMTLSGAGGTLTMYGLMSGAGTFTTDANTLFSIQGGSSQFSLPSTIATLKGLTLNRPSGMKINESLALGFAGTSLTITSGNLDLNGKNITLANVASAIVESVGNTIVNTGATGAYISTVAAGASATIIGTGFGISAVTAGNITVRRYPQTVAISGKGNSVSRIYSISSSADIDVITLKYDDSEINGNRPAALKLEKATNLAFTTGTASLTPNALTTRTVAYTSPDLNYATGTTYYFTFASETAVAGGTNTFTNGAGNNLWDDTGNWSLGTVPTISDVVSIPTGFTVEITSGVNIEANSITIDGNSTLDLGTSTLQINGNLTINSIDEQAFTMESGATLIVGGNITNTSTGNVYLNDVSAAGVEKQYVYVSGTITNTGTGHIYTTSGTTYGTILYLNGSTSLSLPESVSTLHSLFVNKTAGGKLSVNYDLDITGTSTLEVLAGTVEIVEPDATLTVAGNTIVHTGALLLATGAAERTFNGDIQVNGTGVINLSGTGVRNIGSAAGDKVIISPTTAGATLNLSDAEVYFTSGLEFTNTGTLNLQGSDVDFDGTDLLDFDDGTIQTNNNTKLNFIAGAVISNFPSHITNLEQLTLSTVPTTLELAADLTVIGNVTIDDGCVLDINTYTLTVSGTFDAPVATATLTHDTGSKLVLNGPIASATFPTLDPAPPAALLSLTVGGTGAITPSVTYTNLVDVIMNRADKTLQFTSEVTLNSLVVTSGTVKADLDGDFTVTTTTSVASAATLDLTNNGAAVDRTFTTGLSGAGTILADGNALAEINSIYFDGGYSFTGSMNTNEFTDVRVTSTQVNNITLPSTMDELNLLWIDRGVGGAGAAKEVTLGGNLTINGNITETHFDEGTFNVGEYTLTFDGDFDASFTNFTLDAEYSTLVFNGLADFTGTLAAELITYETTNITFGGTNGLITAFPAISDLKTLTINPSVGRTLTLTDDLELAGNLIINEYGLLDVAANSLVVNENVSNLGTLDIDGNGSAITVTLNGLMSGEGFYTTGTNTNLVVAGTSTQLQLPARILTLGTITLNRSNGMKLYSSIALGNSSTNDLVLTKGNLDLNGNNITLANATDKITETAGYTIINTGLFNKDYGYITTQGTTTTNIIASGIGVSTITNSAPVITVRRYPVSIPVHDVGLSTSRVFYISFDPLAGTTSEINFIFDNTELYSDAADLELYTSATEFFTTNTNRSDVTGATTTITENSPVTGKGTFEIELGTAIAQTDLFYALAGLPGDGGVLRTFTVASGNWGDAANWSPVGVPSKFDQVIVPNSTVYLNGNGNIFECKTLRLSHQSATLLPTDNGVNGDNVSLRVMGNITLSQPGAEIRGANGYGRLSIIIGDGVTAGVSSQITTPTDYNYVLTSGVWIHNLTVNMAQVSFTTGNEVRISGNISLLSNTYFNANNNTIVFHGGYGSQTISIPSSASAVFEIMKFENNASVTTTSSFDIENEFLVLNGSSFTANGGFVTFTTAGTDSWNVENGGTLKLFNVEFNDDNVAANDYTPTGVAYIQGDFVKTGRSEFIPASGTIIFSNNTQKEIANASAAAGLIFYNLQVAENSSVVTSTDWQVKSIIDVKNNASLKADNGEISMVNAVPAEKWIKNVSTHTLEFNDLELVAGTTITTDSWVIHGDLTSSGGDLEARNGTISFDNFQEKDLDNGGNSFQFFKLLVTDGSKVKTSTTAANGDISIANSTDYKTGAGIEVEGTGEFYVGNAASVVTFTVSGVGILNAGYPKTITKSSTGKLEFGKMTLTALPNNEVTTASSFTLTGTGAEVFNNEGAGGYFYGTAGAVTFTGLAPVLVSPSPALTAFYGLTSDGGSSATTNLTFTNGHDFRIRGDLTVNGTSTVAPGGINSKIIFDGSSSQKITGTASTVDAIQFADIQINKANSSVLTLETPVRINSNAAHEFVLTNGILNLGSQTLTVGAGQISRHSGVINGATGTYLIEQLHQSPKLDDNYFTVSGTPTLYNLTVADDHETVNDLTVNNNLYLNQYDLTIASGASSGSPKLLTVYGNLSRNDGEIEGSTTLSRLVLTGTGTVTNGLSNDYFDVTAPDYSTTVQLEIARQETLGDDLNIAAGSQLRINTGINDFDLGENTLTFNAAGSSIVMISGGIKAGTDSEVDLTTAVTHIPASMFRDDECYNLTIGADITLGGNLTILGTLDGVYNITTGDNILTFGSLATIPAFTNTAHVIGNLRRYVKNNPPTVFNIGGTGVAAYYTPVTLQFANSATGQAVLIKPYYVDPADGRGGDPKYTVNAYFEITPEGTAPVDSLKAIFQWDITIDGGTTAAINSSFPAKWMGSSWYDYRNKLTNFSAGSPRVLNMSSFPIANPAALKGVWAIFNASDTTTASKDRAISTSRNRLVITSVTPTPVKLGSAFKTTVQLQNQYGQPITVTTPFEIQIQKDQGAATLSGTTVTGVIQPGQSEVTISGMSFTTATGANHILKADTTGGSLNWQMGISEPFSVIPTTPTTQSHTVTFTNVKPTSMTIDWTSGSGTYDLVVIKADTLLKDNEFPVNGITYLANTIYGAGSTFGDAVVVYKGTGTTVNVTGLSPNTNYFVYVFSYTGDEGAESYRTTAAAGNPNSQYTTGSYDDDVAYGINNTRALSKGIGTNTPVRGTVKSDTDEDWFNFTMTSASPNLRIKIYNLPENYNIELYDQTGKRVRRSYLQDKYVDAFIMNELTAGTYTVRVYGNNGAYDIVNPYTLQVTTSSSEIFSVTP